jgi:ribosomal protein L7/L12
MINYDTLTTNQRANLIIASHTLLRTLAEIAGADAANDAWGVLADTIHPNLKNDLLMRMLTGDFQKVVITGVGTNFINCIKVVRTYTNMGLKEIKDLLDDARYKGRCEFNVFDPIKRQQLITELTEQGCTVIG